jgi:hypothetical protein
MPGDDAGVGPLPPDGQIPLARRSCSIDVSSSSSSVPFVPPSLYDCLDVLNIVSDCAASPVHVTIAESPNGQSRLTFPLVLLMVLGSARAAGLHLGLRPRLRAHGAQDARGGLLRRHCTSREALPHHKVFYSHLKISIVFLIARSSVQ